MTVTLPNLATLDLKPSWTNRAGRMDRSGCAEVRAGELARRLPDHAWRQRGDNRIARFELTAELFFALHETRMPLTLVGDLRTSKSNVMKSGWSRGRGQENPNHGAAATKILAIPDDWSQRLTLVRRRQNPRLIYPYLICPGCDELKKKLFMPLCSEAEWRDAGFALKWLQRPTNTPGSELELKLINRYGVLLPPRELRCHKCHGIRHGYAR